MSSSLTDKSILVTGANGGIGYETCKQILCHDPSSLTVACRSKRQADECKRKLSDINQYKSPIFALGGVEMRDARQLEQVVSELPNERKFDVVFIQAGGVFFDKNFGFVKTREGQIEQTVFQNAIGGYLLVQYLLKYGLLAEKARIIFAGGEGARGVRPIIKKQSFHSIENLQDYLEKGSTNQYNPLDAIGVSKLVSALISMKLASLDTSRDYIWFSPGLTGGTYGLDHWEGLKKYLSKYLIFPIAIAFGMAQSPKKAAQKCLLALTGKVGQSGDLIGAPEAKALGRLCDQKPMNPDFTNQLLRDEFFNYLQIQFGSFPKS